MRMLPGTLCCLIALAASGAAFAHAFPDNSSPHVGATLTRSPPQVQIWFNGALEPVFSTLVVKDAKGDQVSQGKGRVDPGNAKLLEATLPTTLPTGKFGVYWSVVSHDGHHTAGHFTFTVK